MRALLKRVICKLVDKERKSEGGIYFPDNHKKDQVEYEVVSAGSETSKELNKGDIILVDGFQGHELKLGDEKYMVIEESQILAVLGD